MLDDLVGLVALSPDPPASAPKAQAAWKALMDALAKADDRYQRAFAARRASAKRERANPPPMIKKVNFCNAAQIAAGGVPSLE
jgi:hypothetical protein